MYEYLRTTLIPLTGKLRQDLHDSDGVLSEAKNRQYANMMVLMISGLTGHIQSIVNVCERRDKDYPAKLKQLRQYETAALLGALTINVSIAAWLAIYFSSDVVRRLLVLSDNSQRLAQGISLNERLTGTDEIAHLDKSFHETAERLALARATESSFLDNANNIICSLDPRGHFESLNRVAAGKLSIPYESLQEYSLPSLVVVEQRATFEKFLESCKETAQASVIETKIAVEDRILDVVWSVLWSTTEQLYFAVAYDITARRDLDRMKQEFLALVTHDLRTPLTTIQGMAIILETGKLGVLPEKASVCLAQIKNESDQILELVNDLLDLSKLEAGELNGDFSAVPSNMLVEKIGEALGFNSIALNSAAEVPAFSVDADLERLSYSIAGVIAELFTEATKEVNLSVSNINDHEIKLSFTALLQNVSPDSMIAINSADASQHSNNSKHRLRLPLCKRLLQLHNVTASAANSSNKMCTLEFRIVLAKNNQ
ncbi:MAG: hypothetical protein K2X81_04885, partial [Candidatus Obscuribacterales bacterium]|nr:hypothetical protein [Candidatus Obscuribacterales bacterium]